MFKNCSLALTCSALALALASVAMAQSAWHLQWVGTWATAPMLAEDGFDVRPFSGTTLREVAHITVGGSQVASPMPTAPIRSPSAMLTAVSAGKGAIYPGLGASPHWFQSAKARTRDARHF